MIAIEFTFITPNLTANVFVVCTQFHKKTELKTTYLSNWITHNCPRLILLLHRYIVHVLSTGYRSIIEKPQVEPSVISCNQE